MFCVCETWTAYQNKKRPLRTFVEENCTTSKNKFHENSNYCWKTSTPMVRACKKITPDLTVPKQNMYCVLTEGHHSRDAPKNAFMIPPRRPCPYSTYNPKSACWPSELETSKQERICCPRSYSTSWIKNRRKEKVHQYLLGNRPPPQLLLILWPMIRLKHRKVQSNKTETSTLLKKLVKETSLTQGNTTSSNLTAP